MEDLIDTEGLVAFISVSLLLGVDDGNMAYEVIVVRAVMVDFLFFLPYLLKRKGCLLWKTEIRLVNRDTLALAVMSTHIIALQV